jgi:hypothetical protein
MKGQVGSVAAVVNTLQAGATLQNSRLAAFEAAVTTMKDNCVTTAAATTANALALATRSHVRTEQHAYTSPKPMRSIVAEAIPFVMCRGALFGNLGWDSDAPLVLERAKELLLQADCMDMVETMKATFARVPGSSVDVLFKTPDMLTKARDRIDALEKVYRTDMPDKFAFIVIRKTRDGLRPNCLVHRAADFLEDAIREHKQGDAKAVSKDIRGKLVSLEGMGRIGGSIAGIWQWLPHFLKSNYLPPDVLAFGKDWIEDE